VDTLIESQLERLDEVRILRYRDDYRVFANSDESAEAALKAISDSLRTVGMRLGVAKTVSYRSVIEGSVKADKLAGLELQDLGATTANTVQKQLLRLHAFGQKYTNSGALRRLIADFHSGVVQQQDPPEDIAVQLAIASDIAFVSPATFPAVAGILSHLISLAPSTDKTGLWAAVRRKMARIPYNGYLEVWLQRVIQPKGVGGEFDSPEPICRIVNGEPVPLWENAWISNNSLKQVLDVEGIVIGEVDEEQEVLQPDEIQLFVESAWAY
jgi:RNA-directed DNA polymerase